MTEMCFVKEGIQGVCFTQASSWQQPAGWQLPFQGSASCSPSQMLFPQLWVDKFLAKVAQAKSRSFAVFHLLCSSSGQTIANLCLWLLLMLKLPPDLPLVSWALPLLLYHTQQHCVPHHLHGEHTDQMNGTPGPINAMRFSGPFCRYITNSPCPYFAGRIWDYSLPGGSVGVANKEQLPEAWLCYVHTSKAGIQMHSQLGGRSHVQVAKPFQGMTISPLECAPVSSFNLIKEDSRGCWPCTIGHILTLLWGNYSDWASPCLMGYKSSEV